MSRSRKCGGEIRTGGLHLDMWSVKSHIYLLTFVNIDIYLLSFFSFVPGNTKFMYDLTIFALSGALYIVMGHFCSDY